MKGDTQVIEFLNRQLALELTAVNQYFLHARMYANWGYVRLGDHEYHESLEEMRHADRLIRRILFLEGLPAMDHLGKLAIGRTVPEAVEGDLALESSGRQQLLEAVHYCESVRDYVSRELLDDILSATEEHIDYLETQLQLIAGVGLQNYLQSQMETAELKGE